ncbi:MAG: DUF2911 domain-containing protein [Calditrichaceae bacterium]
MRKENFAAVMVVVFISGLLFVNGAFSQPALTMPRESPAAAVSQTVGLTEITITYHRPAVKGRQIWDGLVPFNQVWRAGANENTTISFSDPVTINGKDLPAGTYGFHVIPSEKEWILIFSKMNAAWGSFSYDPSEDALRVTAIPKSAEFVERLVYRFIDPSANSVQVGLNWEKLMVTFNVGIDVHASVVNNMRKELRSLPRFSWRGWYDAANYCHKNNVFSEQAEEWVDHSISMTPNFTNFNLKSEIIKRKGNTDEAERIKGKALEMATEAELNNWGYDVMNSGDIPKAIDIFKMNVKRYPDSWNVYDSLGEAYANHGNYKLALDNYSKALSMVKGDNQKQRINDILKNLKNK